MLMIVSWWFIVLIVNCLFYDLIKNAGTLIANLKSLRSNEDER